MKKPAKLLSKLKVEASNRSHHVPAVIWKRQDIGDQGPKNLLAHPASGRIKGIDEQVRVTAAGPIAKHVSHRMGKSELCAQPVQRFDRKPIDCQLQNFIALTFELGGGGTDNRSIGNAPLLLWLPQQKGPCCWWASPGRKSAVVSAAAAKLKSQGNEVLELAVDRFPSKHWTVYAPNLS